jgi:hypothetical protein
VVSTAAADAVVPPSPDMGCFTASKLLLAVAADDVFSSYEDDEEFRSIPTIDTATTTNVNKSRELRLLSWMDLVVLETLMIDDDNVCCLLS